MVNPATRAARIAAALAELEAEREAAEADRAAQAREYLARLGEGVVGKPPLAAAVEAARARLERARADRAAQIAAAAGAGWRAAGGGQPP